jgi:hypothetical protein
MIGRLRFEPVPEWERILGAIVSGTCADRVRASSSAADRQRSRMSRARLFLVTSVLLLLVDLLIADQVDDWRWAAAIYGIAALLMVLAVRAIART